MNPQHPHIGEGRGRVQSQNVEGCVTHYLQFSNEHPQKIQGKKLIMGRFGVWVLPGGPEGRFG